MFPVCSSPACCSSHSQIYINAGLRVRSFSCWKNCDVKCSLMDWSYGFQLQSSSFRGHLNARPCSNFVVKGGRLGSTNTINILYDRDELSNINFKLLTDPSYHIQTVTINDYQFTGMKFVESSSASLGEEELTDFTDDLVGNGDVLPKPAILESTTTMDVMSNNTSASDSLYMDTSSLSGVKTSLVDAINETNRSIGSSLEQGQSLLNNSFDTIISSIDSSIKGVSEAFDDAIGKMTSTMDKTGELASDGVSGFSSVLKDAPGNFVTVSIDTFRHTIIVAEYALSQGATLAVYAYGSLKELLPSEIQNVLNLSEEKTNMFLSPLGTVFQQAYVSLEALERILGLDPSDPIVPFVLFLGASTTLWGTYFVLTYGGYAGDLSPKSSLQLLTGKENAVLIDIRPETLRERDGIPDLRRAARFRYANITLPEVDGSIKKLFKSGSDLENTLLAAVIRDLKIVQDRSKVIVMDDDGARSKGIARSLRKLGLKRPYLMQGGFRSWIKEGLRIKELKNETILTILNEEIEAVLEEINPTPLKLIGLGAGSITAVYAVLEWEKTLQLIGFIGLFLTIYLRLASYEDSEDFKQDVRLLLAPFRVGGRAIYWAIGKLENKGNGLLPTSPSSTDVQSRVLQAAAKHESQPSDHDDDIEDVEDPSLASVNESV